MGDINVSVIMATHNRADVLPLVFDAWRAVSANTRYSFEIICSDDDSDDGTVSLIKNTHDLPIKLLENKKGGAAPARNAAFKNAMGEIIIFTGDDISPSPDFINLHYENYLKYGDNVATLGRIDWSDNISINHLMTHITEIGCEQFSFVAFQPKQFVGFQHFYTSNISVSSKMLKEMDILFNTEFDQYGFEDIELGYRLEKRGLQIVYDPRILARHHHEYDSATSFCKRQISAGRSLYVFNRLHPDLKDKCVCDVGNYIWLMKQYQFSKGFLRRMRGKAILHVGSLAAKYSATLEKRISLGKTGIYPVLCSNIYYSLFRFSFFYGLALQINETEGIGLKDVDCADFASVYLSLPYGELYWNTGAGFHEGESRKWKVWDNAELRIADRREKDIKELWLATMKGRNTAIIREMFFSLSDGEKLPAEVDWHNACRQIQATYDFSHTNDPMILIRKIPENYQELVIDMRVKKEKDRFWLLKRFKHSIRAISNRARFRNSNSRELEINYAYGNPRRIGIVVNSGLGQNKNDELVECYRRQLSVLGEYVSVSDSNEPRTDYTYYVYRPVSTPLDEMQMLQVAYTLLNQDLDYVLVSSALTDYPKVACANISDALIYSELIDMEQSEPRSIAHGRYLRLPSVLKEERIQLCDTYGDILTSNRNPDRDQDLFQFHRKQYPVRESKKRMIFVIPIFLAVGGVERNTIEIMKSLSDQYDYCLITTERHESSQGSLHNQLKGICRYVFDLREISEYQNFPEMLFELKQFFRPELVWLCNNSPWFESHTAQIRQIFHDIPMIAQDVYDINVGWITYYGESWNKKYDRYIAVTELIRDVFIERYGLSNEKIDVIYSAINEDQIKRVINKGNSKADVLRAIGLDPERRTFSYVARVSAQKNPLRFLRLAESVLQQFDDVQFLLVGDGALNHDVREYIDSHKMTDYFKWIPYIDNTPELISAIDGLVITSDYEGLPIVSIEAMCVGTPILTTDVGDIKRFIERYHNGLLLSDHNEDLESFRAFHNELDSLKLNAKKAMCEALDCFSVKTVSTLYMNVFEKAIKEFAPCGD